MGRIVECNIASKGVHNDKTYSNNEIGLEFIMCSYMLLYVELLPEKYLKHTA
jgi:hypothetical protein